MGTGSTDYPLIEPDDWAGGTCDIMAVALHRLYGLPLMAEFEYGRDEESGDEGLGYLWHAWVRLPDGRMLDADGPQAAPEERMGSPDPDDPWGLGTQIREISESDPHLLDLRETSPSDYLRDIVVMGAVEFIDEHLAPEMEKLGLHQDPEERRLLTMPCWQASLGEDNRLGSSLLIGVKIPTSEDIHGIPVSTEADLQRARDRLPDGTLFLAQGPRAEICWSVDLDALQPPADVRAWVQSCAAPLLMEGDCWHFALALNRQYGLPIIGWQSSDGRIQHVVGGLQQDDPTAGPFLDIRGVFETPDLSKYGFGNDAPRGDLKPVAMTPEEVHAQLSLYWLQHEQDSEPYPFSLDELNDPNRYPFAGWCEWLAEFLYEDTLREHGIQMSNKAQRKRTPRVSA